MGQDAWQEALARIQALESAASGVASGPAQSYTFVEADLAVAGSFYGAGVVAKVLPTWTPTVSGLLVLLPPSDNGDPDYAGGNFDVFLWKGSVAGTDFPVPADATGAVSPTAFEIDVAPPLTGNPPSMFVQAGQPYTVILVNWNGTVGSTVDLDGLLNSLAGFGGLSALSATPPPPAPSGFPFSVAQLPDGSQALRPTAAVTSEGNLTVASGLGSHAEGSQTVARGTRATHAEGRQTLAEGDATHAEGGSTHAEGDSTHAEGEFTHAEGTATHAQGYFSHAEGRASHAEGVLSHAYRVGEHAEASGVYGDGSPTQVSRLNLATETTDATPTSLLTGDVFGTASDLLTDNTLSVITGHIGARTADGTAAAGWTYRVAINRASGVTRLVGAATVTLIAADAGASTWTVAVADSATGLAITVTGQAATQIRWNSVAEIVEVRYGTT